jgi:histidinol dehydrogenase
MNVELRHIRLADLTWADRRNLLRRSAIADSSIQATADGICEEIADGGDAALATAGARFGGARTPPLVPVSEMKSAWDGAEEGLRSAIEAAVANVELFHEAQRPAACAVELEPGITIERVWSPLRSVGAYVPGGKAAYPSSLIMTVAPARVAGVDRIVVASPAAPDGSMDLTLLAAAHYLGITEMYAMGGAQAVAAMAYGTESIEPVDKIVGPGNAFVTAAKLRVLGQCAIDMPAGPSEILVLADATADSEMVAVDMLCQAEHGPDSPAVLVTTDPDLGAAVIQKLRSILPRLERHDILMQALSNHGLIVEAPSLEAALEFANDYAAEHVTVITENAERDAAQIYAAGSIYVGHWAPEAAGDYATGANHVLPTGGLARSMSPLGFEDFGSWRQVQTITEEGLKSISDTICTLATAEGLTAHRMSVEVRTRDR